MRWLSTALAFLRAGLIAALAAPVATAQTADDAAWERAKAEGNLEAYQRYLSEFPLGAHAAEAFQRIVEAQLPPRSTPGGDIDIY